MSRLMFLAWLAAIPMFTGCAGTWDTVTSQQFRHHPIDTTKKMIAPEDPVVVLLADPPREGYERAAALRRLKEPMRNKGTQEEQDAVLAMLEQTASSDISPVLRMEAVAALGRFNDTRAPGILMTAYRNAHGRTQLESESIPTKPVPNSNGILLASGSSRKAESDRFPLSGPTGFPPEWVSAIRCRTAESLGRTNRPESAKFLATVAGGAGNDVAMAGNEDRDVRLAAIRGLGQCRQPESVVALAQVLQAEAELKDTAIIGRTHDGLMKLTGKKLPPDPSMWNEVVQAGVVISPEPSWIESTIENAMFWEKQ